MLRNLDWLHYLDGQDDALLSIRTHSNHSKTGVKHFTFWVRRPNGSQLTNTNHRAYFFESGYVETPYIIVTGLNALPGVA